LLKLLGAAFGIHAAPPNVQRFRDKAGLIRP
jgi:hypothetical protein